MLSLEQEALSAGMHAFSLLGSGLLFGVESLVPHYYLCVAILDEADLLDRFAHHAGGAVPDHLGVHPGVRDPVQAHGGGRSQPCHAGCRS